MKISNMLGYDSSKRKSFLSPDFKYILVVERNCFEERFLYLNQELVFEGNKAIEVGVRCEVDVSWIEPDYCNVILYTKSNASYIELTYHLDDEYRK